MKTPDRPAGLRKFEIPGRVALVTGSGGLPQVRAQAEAGIAEIYLHGAHVAGFQKSGEPPLLFMSARSRFASGQPIRGGVPICFPWFGPRAGAEAHGFARLTEWEWIGARTVPGGATVSFRLPPTAIPGGWPAFDAEFSVTVTDQLVMELVTTNRSDRQFDFEDCLHTYFAVGDIGRISLAGLEGAAYLDYAAGAGGTRRVDNAGSLRITGETNRAYLDTTAAVEIRDEMLGRIIRIEKSGSQSTVVWNPGLTQKMPDDFDPAEHRRMVCVESGNVKQNGIELAPGSRSALRVTLSSRPL